MHSAATYLLYDTSTQMQSYQNSRNWSKGPKKYWMGGFNCAGGGNETGQSKLNGLALHRKEFEMVHLMPLPSLEHGMLRNSSKLWRGRVQSVERGGAPKTVPQCRQLGWPHLRLQPQWKFQKQKAHPKASALVNMLDLTHIRNLNTNSWSYKSLKNRLTITLPRIPLSLGFTGNFLLSVVKLHCFLSVLLGVGLHLLWFFLFART